MVGFLRFSFDFMIITKDLFNDQCEPLSVSEINIYKLLCSTCISRARARPSSAWSGAPRAAPCRTKPVVSTTQHWIALVSTGYTSQHQLTRVRTRQGTVYLGEVQEEELVCVNLLQTYHITHNITYINIKECLLLVECGKPEILTLFHKMLVYRSVIY